MTLSEKTSQERKGVPQDRTMIENDEQLNQTRLAIADLESAMAALKRDVLPLNAERFAVMAEPIIDHIRELRQQVEEYVGITAATQVWQMRGDPPAEARAPS